MISLEAVTILSGGALISAELLSMALKNKKVDKQATAEINGIESLKSFTGNDGLKISKNVQLKEKMDFEGCCIIAPTGAGKTTGYFYPNLLSNNIKGSIVVIDPKGELYRDTSHFQEKVCKRKVLRFSPLEPKISERYNLLEQCKDTTEVCQLASTLLLNGALSVELMSGKKTGGVEWIQMAEPLLAAALLYVRDLGEPYNTIENAFELVISLKSKELRALLEKDKNKDVRTQFRIFQCAGGSERTIGSIKVTLATNMKLFTDKNINLIGSYTTFNAKQFREEPTILYLTFPERKSIYLAPFIAPFFTQFIDKLLDNYTRTSLPVNFMMDEFANIGMINNMSVHAATVRSRKISLSICLQSITQLQQVYGKDNAQAILNNLKTKMVLPSLNDLDTLNYISNLCGNTEITVKSKSVSKETTISYSKTTKKLLNLDEIRCLKDDKILILMHNRQPVIDEQDVYYKNKAYTSNVNEREDIKVNYKNINTNEFERLLRNKVKKSLEKQIEDFEEPKKDLGTELFE